MEIIKVSKEEFEVLKKKIKELTDEELDKAAGGMGGLIPCPALCAYVDNHCICPDEDDV